MWAYVFTSLGWVLRSERAALYGNFMLNVGMDAKPFSKQLHHFAPPPAVSEVPVPPRAH